jgi:splicing factor 3B subunit 2
MEKKEAEQKKNNTEDTNNKGDMPEIEYVQEVPSITDLEPMYRQYARVFEAFKLVEQEPNPNDAADKAEPIGQYPPVTSIHTTGTGVPSKVPLLR